MTTSFRFARYKTFADATKASLSAAMLNFGHSLEMLHDGKFEESRRCLFVAEDYMAAALWSADDLLTELESADVLEASMARFAVLDGWYVPGTEIVECRIQGRNLAPGDEVIRGNGETIHILGTVTGGDDTVGFLSWFITDAGLRSFTVDETYLVRRVYR